MNVHVTGCCWYYEKVSGKLSCCITTTNIDGCVY